MKPRRLDTGHTDISEVMHYHTDGGGNDKFTIERIQDVKPYLEQNKQAQRYFSENPQRGELREVADIPNVIVEKWLNEDPPTSVCDNSKENMQRLARKLDSPEYKFLRTDTMKIGNQKMCADW